MANYLLEYLMERRELLIKGGAALTGLILSQNLPESIFAQTKPNRPIVGAIRWDGWFPDSPAGKNLQDPKYADRIPFFAKKNGSQIVINGNNIEVVRKEIDFASQAGLDYWSFCYYHPGDWESKYYNYGFNFYKNIIAAEPSIKAPNYALNLQGMHVGTPDKWGDFCNFVLENTLNDRYQKTQTGRPLIYMYYVADFYNNLEGFDGGKGVDGGKKALDFLRNIMVQNDVNPLIVAQNGFELGLDVSPFDAVGSYTSVYYRPGNFSYNDLGRDNINFANYCLGSNKIVVPTVNMGWNPQPRLLDKDWGKSYSSDGPFYKFPTPAELSVQMQLTKKWLSENQTDVLDKIMLIYAWNEFDEGGFIEPTIDLSTGIINRSRLDAIKQ